MAQITAIIVAAGKGLRMKAPVRKQYHHLAGLPIIVHTLKRFDTHKAIDQIILVVAKKDIDFCRDKILRSANLVKAPRLVPGGDTRQDSVYNGLQHLKQIGGVVVIHDGVRPFVSRQKLTSCIKGAMAHGACILGIPADDTLKRTNAKKTILETLDREHVWLAQTPQAFQTELIKKAHAEARKNGFQGTDDASLVERLGVAVKIIKGSRHNLKITDREDLELARRLLNA